MCGAGVETRDVRGLESPRAHSEGAVSLESYQTSFRCGIRCAEADRSCRNGSRKNDGSSTCNGASAFRWARRSSWTDASDVAQIVDHHATAVPADAFFSFGLFADASIFCERGRRERQACQRSDKGQGPMLLSEGGAKARTHIVAERRNRCATPATTQNRCKIDTLDSFEQPSDSLRVRLTLTSAPVASLEAGLPPRATHPAANRAGAALQEGRDSPDTARVLARSHLALRPNVRRTRTHVRD